MSGVVFTRVTNMATYPQAENLERGSCLHRALRDWLGLPDLDRASCILQALVSNPPDVNLLKDVVGLDVELMPRSLGPAGFKVVRPTPYCVFEAVVGIWFNSEDAGRPWVTVHFSYQTFDGQPITPADGISRALAQLERTFSPPD